MTALRAPLPDDSPESKKPMTTINLTEAQMETYQHVRAMLGDRAAAPLPKPPRGVAKSAWDGRLQTLLEKGVLSSVLGRTPGIVGVYRVYSIARQPHELIVETITEILARRARAAAAARPPAVDGGEEAYGTPVATACDELLARLREKWPKGAPGELKLKQASPWRPAFHGVEARAL